MKEPRRDKDLYRALRTQTFSQLWEKAAAFRALNDSDRAENVALVRAVGVVASEGGKTEEIAVAREWMRELLSDSNEKVRRYATGAIPKLQSGETEESALLDLWRRADSEREKKFLAEALGKMGGPRTLEIVGSALAQNEQRLKATLARQTDPSAINFQRVLPRNPKLRIVFRCRAGLENFVRDEISGHRLFRIIQTRAGLVETEAVGPVCLGDVFKLRCFWEVSFGIGSGGTMEDLARAITSSLALDVFRTFTDGPIRYRLDFVDKGHQRAAVRELALCVHRLAPSLLNGGGGAPWTVQIRGSRVELAPHLTPDPRFAYRRRDVPAASHPPLAACLARLAGPRENDAVWDPFCGSGLELIERALLGGVARLCGTDLSPEAIEITRENIAASQLRVARIELAATDFRQFDPGKVTLIITNPPLGKRVPVPNLRELIQELFEISARTLTPGGRLALANPVEVQVPAGLKLEYRQRIDFGGFHCLIEKYVKQRSAS